MRPRTVAWPACWWCERPLDQHGALTLQARNGSVVLHARCVRPMIDDAKVADYYTAGTLALDIHDI